MAMLESDTNDTNTSQRLEQTNKEFIKNLLIKI